MRDFTSILRRPRRPRPAGAPGRRRAARAFAATAGWLEGRTLLATLVGSTALVPLPLAGQAITPPAGSSSTAPGQVAWTSAVATSPTDPDPGPGSNNPTPAVPVAASPAHDRFKNHVALAEANLHIDGASVPEFALADAGENKVLVKVGLGGAFTALGTAQGIDAPQSVTLADLNNDGIPDLVVANSGADDVLIFPGLPGGGFGPGADGGKGLAVGQDPVSVTVGDINGDGLADLIVANRGSDSLSVFDGQGTGADWTLVPSAPIDIGPAPSAAAGPVPPSAQPVKTVLYDLNGDGKLDLFVCNSGSDDVYMYAGEGDGRFNLADPTVFNVGLDPVEMFVGRFDKRPEVDLVTVNSGSDDLSFVAGVFLPHPSTMSVSSGGLAPDAAFAVDLNHTGVMDLVVANSGDGSLALLRAGNEGMQLAGVITQAGIPVPTGLAPASWDSGGIDFLAAGAGLDAAQLLHFDLGTASGFLTASDDGSGPIQGPGDELFAQLVAFDDSSLELMAVFWTGSPDAQAINGAWGLHESSVTAMYSPTEGQGADEPTVSPGTPVNTSAPPVARFDPDGADSSALDRFVLGLDAALGRPRGAVAALADRDDREVGDDRPARHFAHLAPRPSGRALDPDAEAAVAVDEALRLFWSDGATPAGPEPVRPAPGSEPIPDLEEIDPPARGDRSGMVPAVSAALFFSTRLILAASPPRPSTFRRKDGLRHFAGARWTSRPEDASVRPV